MLLRIPERSLAAGDIATVRLVLRRAVEAGNARAVLLLEDTYVLPTILTLRSQRPSQSTAIICRARGLPR
jgi:hypothetical protein